MTLRSNNIADQAEQLFSEFTGEGEGTMAALARKYGLRVSEVRCRLRLHAMPPEILSAAREGRISEKQVKRLTDTVLAANRNRIFEEMIHAAE